MRLIKFALAGIGFAVCARVFALAMQGLFGFADSTTDYLAGLLNGSLITAIIIHSKAE